MSQIPLIAPARFVPRLDRRVPAAFLWRARDGILSAVTGQAATFSRTGARTVFAANGRLVTAPRDLPRVEMLDLDNDGILETPSACLSPSTTNRVLHMNDLSQSAWVVTNTPTILSTTIPFGALTLQLIEDNSGSVQEYYTQTVTWSDSTEEYAFSFLVAKGTSAPASGSRVEINEGSLRVGGTITWNGEAPVVSSVTGRYVGARFVGRVADSNGVLRAVYRLSFITTASFNPNNSNLLRVYPAFTASEQGNVFIGGFQLEDGYPVGTATSPILTTSASVTAQQDELYFDYTVPPRLSSALTLAVRFVENGAAQEGGRLVSLGGTTTGARLAIASAGVTWRGEHYDGASTVTCQPATTPALNDVVVARVVLREDGSVLCGHTLNGAAEVLGSVSSALQRAATWGADRLYFATGAVHHAQANLLGVAVLYGEQSMAYCSALLA